ncbi:MAG: GNAT family N-acetyltransferase [Rhodobacterales bacterium]|nr:GNAT family N-acetyltransferase [Rhodobacterales bacterium]
MTVRRMQADDLARVLDWAAAEGWNPGHDDAAAFLAADPAGFFVNEVEGRPVAALSVVNHDDDFAFLGLYLCRAEYRGRGLGLEVWQAGVAHAGGRTIGLDGVPAQQANYAKSGFAAAGGTVRFCGAPPRGGPAQAASGLAPLMAADARATGMLRPRFATAWFTDTPARRTLMLSDGGFATVRACGEGVKFGPFHATTPEAAWALLTSVPAEFGAGPVFIDVPDTASDLVALLRREGFVPVFETARMYAGPPPKGQPPAFYAVATLELG